LDQKEEEEMGKKVEEQDTGSTIYQITDDSLRKSDIYCETPYCSPDSRHFVFQQVNPKYETNPCELLIEVGHL